MTQFFKIKKIIFLVLALLGLRCYEWALCSCGEQGLLTVVRVSHCSGFSCCGAQAPGTQGSVVAALGLSSCGSRA